MIRGENILLTGGAGFIGSHLARRLVGHNRVVVYDNGHRGTLQGRAKWASPNPAIIQGDVLNLDQLRSAMSGCHRVLHLAAIAGVDTVLRMPVDTMRVNLIGTYHVLEAAREHGQLRRLIDFSSSEIFGAYAYKVRESDAAAIGEVGEARWTYAVSKLATEHLTHQYFKQYGIPALAVRPFNVYGPGQIGEGAIHRFILQALKNEPLTVHNDGSQIRAWCYIDDVVEATLLCLEIPEAVGQTFNVGNPRSVCTIYELAHRIVRLSGSRSEVAQIPWNSADVELRVPNVEKAKGLLGYEPRVDLDEGLLRTIEWYRQRSAE